jgi:hypothetical protein
MQKAQVRDVVMTVNGAGVVQEVRNQGGETVYLICLGDEGFGSSSDVFTEDEFDLMDDSECEDDYDGQPDEYTEWQDYMGGDDWDHGQYEVDCDLYNEY